MRTKIFILMLSAATFFSYGQQTISSDTPEEKPGMVKVTILYPNGEGKTFDMDYYSKKHMPMVANLLSETIKAVKIDKGIAAGRPNEQMPYLAIGYLYFDSLEDYQSTFGPNAEKIVGDIPNYTNVQPVVQISEVFQ
ncbi:MAG: hypothetical protein Mars2KO_02790 [Maribacter sp.]|uniref:EthD family reductase n=1 Tax=Maribacter sp. 2307UL18-2 TaxID=3386274 RepID=UPI0039BD8EB7